MSEARNLWSRRLRTDLRAALDPYATTGTPRSMAASSVCGAPIVRFWRIVPENRTTFCGM